MRKKFLWILAITLLGGSLLGWGILAASANGDPAALPVAGKVVLIDPGHGGADPGKTGSLGEDEKIINLSIARKLAAYLEAGGALVYMTRTEDETLGGGTKKEDMKLRGEQIRELQPDLFVSIHQNSYTNSRYWGPQVFYYADSEKSEALARKVQEQLNIFTGSDRQHKANTDYYVLRQGQEPGILVECGFLTNPEEEKRLNDETYQKKIAWSIYSGMNAYLEEERNGDTMDSHGESPRG